MLNKNIMIRTIIVIFICLFSYVYSYAQTLTEAEVCGVMNRGLELHKNKQYSEALEAFLTIGANVDASKSEGERQVYVCSQTKACSCYYSLERYGEGYQLAKTLISTKLGDKEKSKVYSQYVMNGYKLATQLMKFDIESLKEARSIFWEIEPYTDEQNKKYVVSGIPCTWYYEGCVYHIDEKYDEALACYNEALMSSEERKLSSIAISALERIADIKYDLGEYDKAIEKYEDLLSQYNRINNEAKQMEIAVDLCKLNGRIGNMKQKARYDNFTDSLFEETKDIEAHFIYYRYRGNEAVNRGDYNYAEICFQKAMKVAKEQSLNANEELIYHDMSNLYYATGRYDEAVEARYLSIGSNKECSKDNYMSYIFITDCYQKKGDNENVKKYLDALFKIEGQLDEPRQLMKIYEKRASYHKSNNDNKSALVDYKKAEEIMSKYPVTDLDNITLYTLIGGVEHSLKNYEQSVYYYRKSADANKELYGEYSMKYLNAQIYLANAQGFAGLIDDGCENYKLAVNGLKGIMKRELPYMNTTERENVWKPLCTLLTRMTPYAIEAKQYQTEYTQSCYDALLMSKAFLLDSERSIYDIIKNKRDEETMQMYMNIAIQKNQIKKWKRNYTEYADSIFIALNKVARLENVLMKKVKSYGDMSTFIDVNYESVKNVLGQNEVLLDFTDFVPKNGDMRYATYIVNQKQKYPLLQPLFSESQIDSLRIVRPDMFYDTDFASDVIKLLWDPIKKHIAQGATVYYVPSQLLFQVCLESLPLEDGTLLGEHYNFVRLSSARELVRQKRKDNKIAINNMSAVLYGGLIYDIDTKLMEQHAKLYDLSFLSMNESRLVRGDSVEFLPYSKIEIDSVSEILNRSKFEVSPYMGMNGTEESFLSMHGKSPQILHLATHGFYYTPTQANEVDYLRGYSDAMSLSGLIMSGGNAAWQGKKLPEGVLGGVLTANNIARLDLSNTDMVVLSACQSGQGNATAEGLYGLQRAFKKAGVGTMVMTLWSVSDKVATEFMIKFYESLAENNWNKHKAFNIAKSQIKEEYPDPYYWAAFVMLD